MNIQVASLADVEGLAKLHCQFRDSLQRQSPSHEEFTHGIAKELSGAGFHAFIAQMAGEVVGYATMRTVDSAWSATPVAVFEELFVTEGCRGKRVGRALAAAVVAHAIQLGCAAISLDTNERNEASQKIYKSLGFTCERRRWAGGRQIRYDLSLGKTERR